MNSDLATLLSLRNVLESAGEGSGVSRAMVRELAEATPAGRETARLLLLGHPISVSLRPLVENGSEEVAMLSSLIVSTPRSSTVLVGKSGQELAGTLERWLKAKESRRLEQKVLRFRSLITSGVLGAVTAMLATLGPLVGSLSFAAPAVGGPGSLLPGAAVMTAVSSGMLGLFMSGRKLLANVVVSLAVFALVAAIASPLASVPTVTLWGVK